MDPVPVLGCMMKTIFHTSVLDGNSAANIGGPAQVTFLAEPTVFNSENSLLSLTNTDWGNKSPELSR